jgi:hypothetical protein
VRSCENRLQSAGRQRTGAALASALMADGAHLRARQWAARRGAIQAEQVYPDGPPVIVTTALGPCTRLTAREDTHLSANEHETFLAVTM